MSETVIKVTDISKRYRLGVKEQADTFAEKVKETLLYPINNFKRIASLNKFKNGEDSSIFWALQQINFEVKKGEVLGIIGRNGAGKSTLLKILSRITEPTTGLIEIKGRVSALLEVGTGFHPELSGRENVYMNGTILGMTKKEIDQKFDEIVAFSGVEQHIDTPVKFYSSGMKVRLGFSVAAHLEPEILIIDEVLAVGDFEFQKRCLGKMDDVAKSGRTVLFVSHDMAAVSNLCSRVILLDKGMVKKDCLPENTISEYLKKNTINFDEGKPISFKKENFDFTVTDLRVSPKNYHNNIIKSGDVVEIFFKYSFKGEIKFSILDIAIHIKDKSDRIITTLSPKLYTLNINNPNENGTILCIIENFPLMPGNFKLDLWLSINGFEQTFQEVITFQVDKGDFFGFGYLPKEKRASLIGMKHKWILP